MKSQALFSLKSEKYYFTVFSAAVLLGTLKVITLTLAMLNKLIVGHPDTLIQVVDTNLHTVKHLYLAVILFWRY